MPEKTYGGVNMDGLIRYITHLPRSGDVELTLLKTHLLIEELLTHILEKKSLKPAHLRKAKLSFAQKIVLIRCFSDIAESSWVWGGLKKINDARNSLSHKLEREEIEGKIADFVDYVETQTEPIDAKFLSEKFSRLHYASFYLYSEISAYANFDPASLDSLHIPTILTGLKRR